jgi:hypothetical protein
MLYHYAEDVVGSGHGTGSDVRTFGIDLSSIFSEAGGHLVGIHGSVKHERILPPIAKLLWRIRTVEDLKVFVPRWRRRSRQHNGAVCSS